MSFLLLVTTCERVERPCIYRFYHSRRELLDQIAHFLEDSLTWKCQVIEIPDGQLQFFNVESS
jgi:hypothetical protein